MADLRNPEFSAVGIDINIRAAEMHLLVNDVPTFDPSEPLGGPSEIDTQIRLNASFQRGKNTVTVMLRMLPENDLGLAPYFRMDLGYWDFLAAPEQFDGRPMAVRMQVDWVAPEVGEPAEQKLTTAIEAQPLMASNLPVEVTRNGEGWVVYQFDVMIDVNLPKMAWMDGQILEDTPQLRQSLIAEMQAVHRALRQGAATARPYLDGFVARTAAAVGAPPDAYYARSIVPLIDDPDTALVPFDVADAEFRIFGQGRLAAFVPLPHRFASTANEGWQTTLYLYYWKDTQGNWRINH